MLAGVWPGVIKTTRPLPAGEYRVLFGAMPARQAICDARPRAQTEASQYVLTVTSPAGTLAESFFDPYADGAAVTGTTTVGTISWQPGQVEVALTQDATGHALDFIALDGTTTLSLIVADATEDAGTLSWVSPHAALERRRPADAAHPQGRCAHADAGAHTDRRLPRRRWRPTPIPTDRPVVVFLDSLDATVLESLEMAVGDVYWVSVVRR